MIVFNGEAISSIMIRPKITDKLPLQYYLYNKNSLVRYSNPHNPAADAAT